MVKKGHVRVLSYSNIAPQTGEFNRFIWADAERLMRRYVVNHGVPLYVVTLPILEEGLSYIPQSIHKVSIPKRFSKVAYDPVNNRSIGFILDNEHTWDELDKLAVSVDVVEKVSGYDFFSNHGHADEVDVDLEAWFENIAAGDVDPLPQNSLPPGYFNSVVGGKIRGRRAIVCGKMVSSRYSKKGNLWMNLDKTYPNSCFNIFVRKENLINFEYDLVNLYQNELICVEGEVNYLSDNPTIRISDGEEVWLYEDQ